MSVYKEFFAGVDSIIKNSEKHTENFYGSTCKIGDPTYNMVKQLARDYGVPGTREVHKTKNRITANIVIEGMGEWNPKAPKIRYKLTFVKVKHPFKKMDVHFVALMRL